MKFPSSEPYHIEVVQQSNLLFGLEPFEIAFVKGDPDAAELWDEDWQSDTIRWICQCSLLRKLVIDAGVINFVLPTELAEMSAALPLTDVCLKGSALGSLSDASKFWPKVTRFYWDMSCQLADLPHLTGQPNLQHLGLKLVQSNTSGLHLYNGTPTLPALQTFELLGWPFTLGPDLSFIAQGLPFQREGYRVSGWRGLVNYAQHRTLLPNLARLTLSAFPISDHEQFLWIKVFLSPSLHTIQVVPQLVDGVATISTLVAGSLLGHIVKNCPKLRTLSLFPSNSPSFHSTLDGHGYSIADFCDNSFYDRLSALNLSELSCTTAILSDNGIYVLGTLPLLERLTLYSSASAIAVAKPPCTPALQHFGLYSTYWDEIRQIWALDLFSTLNSLTISFVDTEDSDDEQVVDWGGALMSLIACHSPALTDLEIDFGTLELELDTMSTLSPLVQLPLATVSFKSLGAMADEIVENIESIFPNATKLAFFELVFTLSELAHFSKLQRLQHLAIGLAGDTKDIVLSSTHTFSNSLHTLEIYYDMDIGPDMSIFAQYVPIHPCHNRYA
ncbi:F-box protein [Ceratobasidium sp. AG-Ba]|nr:F-box protein [Ceratobasidium sp. AG-Ba]